METRLQSAAACDLIADSIEVGDAVINEVRTIRRVLLMTVELINRSNKIIDLRFVTLATLNDSLQLDDQAYIAPNGFFCFSRANMLLYRNGG